MSVSPSPPPGGRPSSAAAARGDARPPMKPSGVAWLGDIPEDWDFPRIHSLFYEVNDRYSLQEDGEWPLLSVSEYYGVAPRAEKIDEDAILVRAETLDGYKKCQPGDLVINIMLAWKNALGVAPCAGIVSPAYCVYRAREGVEPRYYHHLFRTKRYGDVFRTASTGIIDSRLRLYSDKFFAIHAPLPPLSEQRAIADFLDEKCAAIDALADEAKASLAEYADWKRSIIFHAVTKGIPGDGGGRPSPAAAARGDARPPMKDSGVEWIGPCPSSWKILPLKALCEMESGKTLSSEQILSEGPYPVYGANGLRGFYTDWNTEGPILLVGRQGALCGNVHKANGRFWATEHALRTHPKEGVELGFLFYLLTGMNLNRYVSQTAAQPGLAASTLLNVRTILPSLSEQHAIAVWLDERCEAIDALVEEKKRLLDDLAAYKKSLIYETVTGKRRIGA